MRKPSKGVIYLSFFGDIITNSTNKREEKKRAILLLFVIGNVKKLFNDFFGDQLRCQNGKLSLRKSLDLGGLDLHWRVLWTPDLSLDCR